MGEESGVAGRRCVDLAVTLFKDDLGSEVLGRAAERPRAVLNPFGEAEVGELEGTILRHQDVLELQVSVDNAHAVQVLNR